MAENRVELSERIQERIAQCEAEVRTILYGSVGCPTWGTSFAEIELVAMSVGEELSRRFMSAFAGGQEEEMPPEALVCEGEAAQRLGTKTVRREVLASRKLSAPEFGVLMASYTWSLGFFQAKRKGFVGDGQAANWTIWEKQFKPYGFVPILDFIHALTYLRNQQQRMNYPDYRRQGLAITSCHIESTIKQIKQINYRVKGSEMFWTDDGAEALLQLSADLLCDSTPLDGHWNRRAAKTTGYRVYGRSKT